MEKIKKAIAFVFTKDTLVKILLVQIIFTIFVFSSKGIPLRLENYDIRLATGYNNPLEVRLSGDVSGDLSGDLDLSGSIDSDVRGGLDLGEKSKYGFSVLIRQ